MHITFFIVPKIIICLETLENYNDSEILNISSYTRFNSVVNTSGSCGKRQQVFQNIVDFADMHILIHLFILMYKNK